MQFDVNAQTIIRPHFEIVKVVDGDGLIVKEIFSGKEKEVRLYGIDAPELCPCKKLKQDELETHLPGQFLMKLGMLSYQYLKNLVEVGDPVTLIQEVDNSKDKYGRTLAYVILHNEKCLNEIMIKNGYAKPYDKIFCAELPKYQELNLKAKKSKKGLYSYSNW